MRCDATRKNPSNAGVRPLAIFDRRRETSQEYAKKNDRRRRQMRKLLVVTVAAFMGVSWNGIAVAQDYPVRPITMIVPFLVGGATDTLARFLGERIRATLGQPVIIENVGGAAGSIGVGRAVRSPADGYSLSIGTSTTHMLTGGLYKLQFDLLTDLDPVILIGSEPLLIVGKKSLPADDLKGLIAWLKANPDKASVGIAGVGATGHLTGISFQKATGTKFEFVPYRGNAPAMQDLLAEQIDFMIEPSSNFKALFGAGSVKPFAITGRTRLRSSPDIPTADEAGLPGFHASLWYGLWGAEGTAKEVVANLRRHRRVRKTRFPVGDADLADIDVAFGIERQPVRRQEFAGLKPRAMLAAEPCDAVALGIDDGQARAEIGHFQIDGHAGTEFADDEIRMLAAAAMQRAGPVQIVPLGLVSAVAVEHLDAVIFAVGDIDPSVRIGCDVVDDVELAGIGAGLAPAFEQPAVGRVCVDAGVAVTVGDVDLPLGRQRSMRAAVKRLAAHERRRLVRYADCQ